MPSLEAMMPSQEAVTQEPKKAVSQKDMTKWQWTWKEMKRNKVAYFMVAPFMLIFITFTVVPVLLSLVLSFTNFNMLQWPGFVGFENYSRLFLDDDIFSSDELEIEQ